ncbi:polysaccharide deacetylase family protein [Cohnella luojiensis]|nr:polysaccharide deacetylase family protein [Cohnella luojiensis]
MTAQADGIDPVGLHKLLIVYSEESVQEKAIMLANLSGHFRMTAEMVTLSDMTVSRTKEAEFVIFISSPSPDLRKIAENKLRTLKVPILWIGEPPGGQERNHKTLSAIRYLFKELTYTDRSSPIFRLPELGASIKPIVLAEASDGDQTVPLLVAAESRWFFLSQQLFGIPGKILEDGLHDFFGEAHEERHEGYIRIEDVHPYVEPERLIKIADLLYERNIPYMVAVIPVYVNPKSGEHIQMGQRPEFVRTLKYMADHGASIIMHGYTHQYRMSETGEGFEFWDSIQDTPVDNEEKYTLDKLDRGIAVLLNNGIIPVAFEPPHYTMSQDGYRLLSRYFSTLVAQLQVSDRTYLLTQQPPYRLDSKRHGLHVIPETIGYVLNQPGYPELMRPEIDQMMMVRDSVIGGFFHPYLPIEKLEELLDILYVYPLDYIDLNRENNRVFSDFAEITSSIDGVQVKVLDQVKLDRLGAPPPVVKKSLLSDLTYLVTWGIAFIVLGFLVLFVYILIRLNRKKRAAIFTEREARSR